MELLVTVKAYPEVSTRRGEVVCVAGIRTDVQPVRWVRLWPIDFRSLESAQNFSKYQFVTVNASPSRQDSRPESFAPDPDTLRLGPHLSSGRGWEQRRRYVEPAIGASMCELQRQQERDRTSLGAFRPLEVYDLEISEDDPWNQDKHNALSQLSLLNEARQELEWVPYRFRYVYRCAAPDCRGEHRQTIVDWEIKQAWRRWHRQYPEDWRERIRQRWLDQMCSPDRDTVFFVGNQFGAPKAFLVLGVYWPPKSAADQLSLLEM